MARAVSLDLRIILPIPEQYEVAMIALRRIDANTFEATLKKSGKVVQTARNIVLVLVFEKH